MLVDDELDRFVKQMKSENQVKEKTQPPKVDPNVYLYKFNYLKGLQI